MRGPWDLRFFLLQQALVLVGALGLIFSSCGPLRESPYKSSLFGSRLGSSGRTVSCLAFFVPQNSAVTQSLTAVLSADALDSFQAHGTSTFEGSAFPSGFSECTVELDLYAALQFCTAEDLHSEAFRIFTSTTGQRTTVQLEHESAPGTVVAAHCALHAVRGIRVNTDAATSIAADARTAALTAWP